MAIIVVLAAVAIPTFGRQLETARETGDMELIRSAYTEALSMAVLDASDGKMDGKNGGTALGATAVEELPTDIPSATITPFPDTTNEDKECTYIVVLDKMDSEAKIKQTGTGWQYVNNQILGQTVADVTSQKGDAAYTQAVYFKFEMQTGDGNVRLKAYSTGNGAVGIGVINAE